MQASLLQAYFQKLPSAEIPSQCISFGTSGHRGSALQTSFNEYHVLAIAQAVADYRKQQGYTGPLYLGRDTHALSHVAWQSALSVLVANSIDVLIDADPLGITATPVISHAILSHNAAHPENLSDGLIITPSHNPPEDGGIKYNPAHGGAAGSEVTGWIEGRANNYLASGLVGVKRVAIEAGVQSAQEYDYTTQYLTDLEQVINLDEIRRSGLRIAVDPLGGAGLPIWQRLQEITGVSVSIVNDRIDADFSFIPPDHDGKIRMDCSSPFVMENLISHKASFDLAFANDPDADRHGIVDQNGLMAPNHFLAVCVDYLLRHRPQWPANLKIGKTLVSSSLIDRVVLSHQRELYETPVGLKWFVDGFHQGWLAFGGEESAGATLLTRDGKPWSTDKDGIALCLLAAEIMAVTGKSPSEYYKSLSDRLGRPAYRRVDAPLNTGQKVGFKKISAEGISVKHLAGEAVINVLTLAPGNQKPFGGVKVITQSGWVAVRPSGTEPLYKIYAESFKGELHLNELINDTKGLLSKLL